MVEAPRGVIYDRNGQILLVENRAGLSVGLLPMDMYDPEDEPAQFQAEIAGLAELLEMPEADLLEAYEKATKDPYVTYVVKEDVPENTVVAYLKEHSLEFPGVEVEKYVLCASIPYKALATHLLGYVGEISESDLDQTGVRRARRPAPTSARTGWSGPTTRTCGAPTAGRRSRSTPPAGR